MPEEKRSVLSASLSYYREALHASNPFHSIISYFSSMSALVRGTQQGLRVYTQDLKEKIRKTIEIDENQFNGMWEKCYGNYKESSANFSRSAADHGHIDITSPQKIEEARNNIEPVVRAWSEKMIDSFINDNQVK
jgi:hypothetical protein